MNADEILKTVTEILKKFPQLGMSGQKTFYCVDKDVFLETLEKVLEANE